MPRKIKVFATWFSFVIVDCIPVMFIKSLFHRSPCFSNVHEIRTLCTGNSVYYTRRFTISGWINLISFSCEFTCMCFCYTLWGKSTYEYFWAKTSVYVLLVYVVWPLEGISNSQTFLSLKSLFKMPILDGKLGLCLLFSPPLYCGCNRATSRGLLSTLKNIWQLLLVTFFHFWSNSMLRFLTRDGVFFE